MMTLSLISDVFAEEDTGHYEPTQRYAIPAGPLGKAISGYAAQSGVRLTFDPALAEGKETQGLSGEFSVNEGFQKLLDDSGLEAIDDQNGGYFVVPTQADIPALGDDAMITDMVNVRARRFYEVGPLPGLGLTKDEIPGNVQSLTAEDIKEAHALSMTDLFNQKLQGVTVNDYQGNPFQMDIQYRGFTAGPQIGTPQGLSVFFDGIRVNEPFGDVVNWDMIPMNAISSVDVFPGSNPIFGLNTLGGAFTVKTKDGFNYTKSDVQLLAGSFDRKQLQVDKGWNNGTIAFYGAGSFHDENGWRDNSPSKVNQVFGKASYRGDKIDMNLSTLIVKTKLVGNGLSPVEEYEDDSESVFTGPDKTDNDLQQFQLSGAYQVNEMFSVTAQVYRRNSDRHQIGSDVITDWDDELVAKRLPAEGEEFTCLFNSTNEYGLPDYYVVAIDNYEPDVRDEFTFDNDGSIFIYDDSYSLSKEDFATKYANNKNTELPDDFLNAYRGVYQQNKNFKESETYNRDETKYKVSGPESAEYYGENSYRVDFKADLTRITSDPSGVINTDQNYFFTTKKDPITNNDVIYKNYVMLAAAVNETDCLTTRASVEKYELTDDDGNPITIDGAYGYKDGVVGAQSGYIPGTPTAIITDNQITQSTDGASIQFNWNLDKHKFMVGMSIDDASAEYRNSQRLGFFTANREAYLDPDSAHPQFLAAFDPLENSNFSGTNTTKSIYFSETWNPIENWNFNFSGRYNDTKTKSKIATRYGPKGANYSVTDLIGEPDQYNVCPDGDCTGVDTNFTRYRLDDTLEEAETEEFSYYSFNPSIGATWQAKETLNVYANWSQGTRVPSVIELGCAADHTPTGVYYEDGQGGQYEIPKSVLEERTCYLPNTLSGDPYLPQIKATSYDIGVRGIIGENMQWNLGAYQTDLKDDIYFVAVGGGSGFYDTIGDTRRRGIEAGLSGQKGKWGFSVNYALTEATFEDPFVMISDDNGSAVFDGTLGAQIITVDKGDTMPGVSRHNVNATINYEVTPKWLVGFSAVMHSGSYVRGNENNDHEVGQVQYRELGGKKVPRRPMSNKGELPGFATFNFQTSYKFTPNMTATFLVNNVFDKEYYSAGRLGRNPFSPSVNGARGPDNYNHNSNDWLSTNFIAPGAPRAAWLSLNWQFD
ncbi:MAG TPA: TonB-dependent receptor [Methylophaga aminisulfidivorans]|uniref:TonB-dependent receptor n=1 Tax=Methylophaga aminisulfidivorans TaxID=230105 RepID=A0A7C1ZRG3_9GAMM|nr:TonB-dependent receptor [Methylophaga aminisulfidivorans]